MEFRPCIDIHDGKVKQIVGGSLKDIDTKSLLSSVKENFVSHKSASEFAELYKLDELSGGHIICLGSDEATINAAKSALRTYPGGLQFGGGVTTENATSFLNMGASHVIVTSYVFNHGDISLNNLQNLVNIVGKERLVLDLSCRKRGNSYFVVTNRWQRFTSYPISEANIEFLSKFCDEFLVHGVDVEGLKQGLDEDLVHMMGSWSPIPVTYAGGARSLDDLDLVKEVGKNNVNLSIGSALDIFGGELEYRSVVNWHNSNQL